MFMAFSNTVYRFLYDDVRVPSCSEINPGINEKKTYQVIFRSCELSLLEDVKQIISVRNTWSKSWEQ